MDLDKPQNLTNITLNEEGKNLECEIKNGKKIFKVPKSHFNDAKSGYYFIHHRSSVNGLITHYETFGANVVFPKSVGRTFAPSFILFSILSLLLI